MDDDKRDHSENDLHALNETLLDNARERLKAAEINTRTAFVCFLAAAAIFGGLVIYGIWSGTYRQFGNGIAIASLIPWVGTGIWVMIAIARRNWARSRVANRE